MIHFKNRFLWGFGTFILFSGLLFSRAAYAYLDPGSGSFFIQLLIAALVAIPLTFKAWLKKIFDVFFKRKPKDKAPEK